MERVIRQLNKDGTRDMSNKTFESQSSCDDTEPESAYCQLPSPLDCQRNDTATLRTVTTNEAMNTKPAEPTMLLLFGTMSRLWRETPINPGKRESDGPQRYPSNHRIMAVAVAHAPMSIKNACRRPPMNGTSWQPGV